MRNSFLYSSNKKKLSIPELKGIQKYSIEQKLIVGHCHGCFDLLHKGHILHFIEAKNQCDLLVVSITSDRYVNKGPNRPVISQEDRAFMLQSLSVVDHVVINDSKQPKPVIDMLKPNLYFKGLDYRSDAFLENSPLYMERCWVEAHGGKLVITKALKFSTTSIVEKILGNGA